MEDYIRKDFLKCDRASSLSTASASALFTSSSAKLDEKITTKTSHTYLSNPTCPKKLPFASADKEDHHHHHQLSSSSSESAGRPPPSSSLIDDGHDHEEKVSLFLQYENSPNYYSMDAATPSGPTNRKIALTDYDHHHQSSTESASVPSKLREDGHDHKEGSSLFLQYENSLDFELGAGAGASAVGPEPAKTKTATPARSSSTERIELLTATRTTKIHIESTDDHLHEKNYSTRMKKSDLVKEIMAVDGPSSPSSSSSPDVPVPPIGVVVICDAAKMKANDNENRTTRSTTTTPRSTWRRRRRERTMTAMKLEIIDVDEDDAPLPPTLYAATFDAMGLMEHYDHEDEEVDGPPKSMMQWMMNHARVDDGDDAQPNRATSRRRMRMRMRTFAAPAAAPPAKVAPGSRSEVGAEKVYNCPRSLAVDANPDTPTVSFEQPLSSNNVMKLELIEADEDDAPVPPMQYLMVYENTATTTAPAAPAAITTEDGESFRSMTQWIMKLTRVEDNQKRSEIRTMEYQVEENDVAPLKSSSSSSKSSASLLLSPLLYLRHTF